MYLSSTTSRLTIEQACLLIVWIWGQAGWLTRKGICICLPVASVSRDGGKRNIDGCVIWAPHFCSSDLWQLAESVLGEALVTQYRRPFRHLMKNLRQGSEISAQCIEVRTVRALIGRGGTSSSNWSLRCRKQDVGKNEAKC